MYKVFDAEPEGFNAKVHVAASYVNVEGKLLLLKLSSIKNEAGAWGVPAGKIEMNEPLNEGARRELFEETGLVIASNFIRQLGTLYFRKPDIDYTYHLFGVSLYSLPEIQLSDEHSDYTWVTLSEAFRLNLMIGAKEALEAYTILNNR